MDKQVDRLALNAAIEQLIAGEGNSDEAARIVIEYGYRLKKSGSVIWQAVHRGGSSDGPSISGHTAEQGNITVKDQGSKEDRVFEFGIHKERVGHYRVWKRFEGVLGIHHFWKSDVATQATADERSEYWLGYDPTSFAFKYFAIEREKIWLSWTFRYRHEIGKCYLERISGTGKMPNLPEILVKSNRID